MKSLCESCVHVREVVSGTGSRFLLCQLSQQDRRFPKYPPQPMVGQTRAVLDRYAAAGGRYREIVFAGRGHSPHVEDPRRFAAELASALS